MRPVILYYCLVQAPAADPRRRARREAPAAAASRARRPGTPRRGYRARRLPAVVKRRMLTALGGGPSPHRSLRNPTRHRPWPTVQT